MRKREWCVCACEREREREKILVKTSFNDCTGWIVMLVDVKSSLESYWYEVKPSKELEHLATVVTIVPLLLLH